MARGNGRRAGKPTTEIDYSALEDQDYRHGGSGHESQASPVKCTNGIELSDFVRNWKGLKYFVFAFLGMGLAGAAFFLAVAVAVIVRSVTTDNTGFDPGHPDFALYKNSRFKECYNLVPDTQNCTAIRAGLRAHSTRLSNEFGYVDNTAGWAVYGSAERRENPPIYDWCQIVSCFNGFKIIPSEARPSATILPDIVCWWIVMATCASALYHTGKQLWAAYQSKDKPCEGRREISWLDWILIAYDIGGPILFWWVSFGLFAADPAQSATIALTAWVAAWKLGSVTKYHPYSCALQYHPRARVWIPRLLNLMALLQWAGGVYIMVVYLGDLSSKGSTLTSYDCLASGVAAAPGSTSCSAADLCSKTPLFRNLDLRYGDTSQIGGRYTLLAFFWTWTLMAITPFIFLLIGWLGSKLVGDSSEKMKEDARYIWRVVNLGPHFYIAFTTLICVGFSVAYAVHMLQTWDSTRNREAPFTFHYECNALHVELSPWRNFLDLSEYSRAYRIVKMAFVA
ncbi:uncharacterized protein B0H64DRAFT_234068 [Chaetomium fimeti]|uniref:Uncharacterized protein n=1 Tax=Chaetomium fimeti TaxID=1854472 RepID=A0AAE0H9X5_9PEZI|nr:hypothetical protein B0H64DRAFT_234068 [Chaetomium fimeti]